MITEGWFLAELSHAIHVRKFRGNPNFRDHVRINANRVAEPARLIGVARVTGEFALPGGASAASGASVT
jgi:hypothetical protein